MNDAPVANDDTATTAINTPVTIDVKANDKDVDNDNSELTVSKPQLKDPSQGSVSIDADGKLVFIPAPNVTGPVEITYTLTDPAGASDTGTVIVTVGGNTPPDSADQTRTTLEDTPYAFKAADFVFKDADAGQSLQGVRIDSTPASGSLSLNGVAVKAGQVIAAADLSKLVFTPSKDGNGSPYTSFTFSVQDSAGAFDSKPNTITFNVTPVNDAPDGTDKSFALAAGAQVVLTVADFGFKDLVDEPAPNAFKEVIIFPATGGTLTLNGIPIISGSVIVSKADLDAGKLVYTAPISANSSAPTIQFHVVDDGGLANGGRDTDATANKLTFNTGATQMNGVDSLTAIDNSLLGLNGEFYGYNDIAAGTSGRREHVDDTKYGNLDRISDMVGIVGGRNAANGGADGIVGSNIAADANTPDARFTATKINYGGVSNSLGTNPLLDKGDNTGSLTVDNSALYKFLSQNGNTDAASLQIEHGLGRTTDAGVRVTGYIYMEQGYYDFSVYSDDGFRLKIDDQVAIQFDGIRSPGTSNSLNSTSGGNTPHPDGVYVKGGMVAIELLYWEQGSNGVLHFQYKPHNSSGGAWQTLDLSQTLLVKDNHFPALNDLQDVVKDTAGAWAIRTGDVLDGGNGVDTIVGSAGRDYIMGGKGNDVLTGGDGSDRFIYSVNQNNGHDVIKDFTVGKDKLVFTDVLSAQSLDVKNPDWVNPSNASWNDTTKTLSFETTENGQTYTNTVTFDGVSGSYANVTEFLNTNGII